METLEEEPEVKIWEEQGRTAEQKWAVVNFLTGQGKIMIDRLLHEQDAEILMEILAKAESLETAREVRHLIKEYLLNTI